MEWVKCEDQMPENSKAVLIWCPSILCAFTANWMGDHWDYFGGYAPEPVENKVTHWMALPKSP